MPGAGISIIVFAFTKRQRHAYPLNVQNTDGAEAYKHVNEATNFKFSKSDLRKRARAPFLWINTVYRSVNAGQL